jgi:BirA family biotin operon repressor/biotin-[acetyl-CoA-carboxylase] ligase
MDYDIIPDLTGFLTRARETGRLGPGMAHRLALVGLLTRTLPPNGRPLSGEELARALGLTRAAVHKHVEHLRTLGFRVESVAGAGYRLAAPYSDLVAAEAVLPYLWDLTQEPALRAQCPVGLPYHYHQECWSTNALARESALTLPSGAVVVTDRQTRGRGRLDRTWLSEPGKDLTFSVLLRPSLAPAQAQLMSLAAGLAVAEVLEGRLGLRGTVGLKWPNDVLLDGRKVCGVLVEGSLDADRLHWVVVGVGLNVNSQASRWPGNAESAKAQEWKGRPRPVSLAEYLGRPLERAPLLAGLLAGLGERCAKLGTPPATAEALLAAWRERDVLLGQAVEVATSRGEAVLLGTAVGLGPEGQLLVRETGGKRAAGRVVPVFAGDVRVRGLPTV